MEAPAFGTVFTDHMARITWTADDGWCDRRVEPHGPILLDPAAAVLHYGQEIFEGLKAYRHADGSVWGFRPYANAARFAASARRLALPELPAEDFLGSIEAWWLWTSTGCRVLTRRACTCGRSCSPRRRSWECGRREASTTC